jgi:hypothetical protein
MRFAVLRLLIPAGRDGLRAGAIGERLGLPANNLSLHLGRLVNARLIYSWRQGRHLCYARLAELVSFLADDCCAAAPEGCLPERPSAPSMAGQGCGAGRKRRSTTKQKGR